MSIFKFEAAVANQGGAMEADTISINGDSPKNHSSRRNFLSVKITLLSLVFSATWFGCTKEDQSTMMLAVYDMLAYSVQPGTTAGEFDISRTMVVMEEGTGIEQNIALDKIKNFTYEKGYEYLLKVNKTTNKEDYQYSLKEIVSKIFTREIETIVINVTTEWVHQGTEGALVERLIVNEEESTPLLPVIPASFKIEGFQYEKGFDYRLKVEKTVINMPPQTGFVIFNLYEVVEIISKTPKTQ